MAKYTNSDIDIDANSWSEQMAVTVGDGTFADVLEESKTDEGATVPASQIKTRAGALYGNVLGRVLEEVWDKARAGAGLQTVYELDLTAEASSGALSDGVVTIDGKNWTMVNVARLSTAEIVNGSGLQLAHTAGTSVDIDNGTDFGSTAGYLYCNMATLAPEWAQYGARVRVWAYIPTWSAPVSANHVIAAIGVASGTGYSASTWGAGFQYGTPATAIIKYGSTEVQGAPDSSSHNVLVMDSVADSIMHVYSGTWSSGWPAFTSLLPVGRNIVTGISTAATFRNSAASLMLGVASNSASGAPSATFARIKIEVG